MNTGLTGIYVKRSALLFILSPYSFVWISKLSFGVKQIPTIFSLSLKNIKYWYIFKRSSVHNLENVLNREREMRNIRKKDKRCNLQYRIRKVISRIICVSEWNFKLVVSNIDIFPIFHSWVFITSKTSWREKEK